MCDWSFEEEDQEVEEFDFDFGAKTNIHIAAGEIDGDDYDEVAIVVGGNDNQGEETLRFVCDRDGTSGKCIWGGADNAHDDIDEYQWADVAIGNVKGGPPDEIVFAAAYGHESEGDWNYPHIRVTEYDPEGEYDNQLVLDMFSTRRFPDYDDFSGVTRWALEIGDLDLDPAVEGEDQRLEDEIALLICNVNCGVTTQL